MFHTASDIGGPHRQDGRTRNAHLSLNRPLGRSLRRSSSSGQSFPCGFFVLTEVHTRRWCKHEISWTCGLADQCGINLFSQTYENFAGIWIMLAIHRAHIRELSADYRQLTTPLRMLLLTQHGAKTMSVATCWPSFSSRPFAARILRRTRLRVPLTTP